MPAVFEFPYIVVDADIDELGHANNLSYLRWMLDAAVTHSAIQGWPGEAYRSLGAGWVVRSHQIEYLQPAFAGDAVVVRTWVADMKKVTSLRRYKIVRATGEREVVLATASTDWAFIHFATGVPRRIPAEVLQAFEVVPEGGWVGGLERQRDRETERRRDGETERRRDRESSLSLSPSLRLHSLPS